MRRLSNISGKEAVKVFEKAGRQAIGQVGSHLVIVKMEITVFADFSNPLMIDYKQPYATSDA